MPTLQDILDKLAAVKALADEIGRDVGELGTAPEPPATPISAAMINARLGVGISLGTALEAPREGDWGVTIEADDFRRIAAAGFRHVRLPARTSAHAGTRAPYTIEQGWMDRLNWCLDQAEANGLVTIFDPIHHYNEIYEDARGHRERFKALWSQLASLTARRSPEKLVVELLNEPRGSASKGMLSQLVADGVAAVRAQNPDKAIMIGCETNNSMYIPPEFQPPADKPLIFSVHCYTDTDAWTNAFTHQVVMGNPAIGAWKTKDKGKAWIQRWMDNAQGWAKARGMPVNLGEFGCSVACPEGDRLEWLAFVNGEAAKRGWSRTLWDDRSNTFGLRQKGKDFPDGVRKALGLA